MSRMITAGNNGAVLGSGPGSPAVNSAHGSNVSLGRASVSQVAQSISVAAVRALDHVNSLQSKTIKIGDLHHALDKSLHVINHQETSSRLHELFSELAETILRQNQGVSLCLQHVREMSRLAQTDEDRAHLEFVRRHFGVSATDLPSLASQLTPYLPESIQKLNLKPSHFQTEYFTKQTLCNFASSAVATSHARKTINDPSRWANTPVCDPRSRRYQGPTGFKLVDRPYDMEVYANKLSVALMMGKSVDRMDLSSLYRSMFWLESPLMHMASNLKYMAKMNNPVQGFLESSSRNGNSNESNIHKRLTNIVENVVASKGHVKPFIDEMSNLLTECARVHNTMKSLSTDMLAFTTFNYHTMRSCRALLTNVKRQDNNLKYLGISGMRAFVKTTPYGKIFQQLESIVQDFIIKYLEAIGCTKIEGVPTLQLNMESCRWIIEDQPDIVDVNDSDEWVDLVSKAEVYPEGLTTSPVLESSVGVKRSLNLPSSDYDGHRRLRKIKTSTHVDDMLEPGAGYGSSRRARNNTSTSSRRSSIDSTSSMLPPTRTFLRGPDLSFIHDSHPLVASRAEQAVYSRDQAQSSVDSFASDNTIGNESMADQAGPARKRHIRGLPNANFGSPAPSHVLDFVNGAIHPSEVENGRDEFPEETRSVCSISHHMERLGRTTDTGAENAITERNSNEGAVNTSGACSQGDTSSTLDARIQALSEMQPEERCAQLNQDAIQAVSGHEPMEGDFTGGFEEDDETPTQGEACAATVVTTDDVTDADMPDLEGSDIDFEAANDI